MSHSLDDSSTSETALDRRTVLSAAGVVGVAGVLAACSSGAGSSSPSPSAPASPTESPTGGGGGGGGTALTTTAEVPVGGGTVVEDKQVVVTQPAKGEYHAFSAVCTHQGCIVGEVTAEAIICPCHGSQFSATTGEVLNGPATMPLAEVAVKVEGTDIVAGA